MRKIIVSKISTDKKQSLVVGTEWDEFSLVVGFFSEIDEKYDSSQFGIRKISLERDGKIFTGAVGKITLTPDEVSLLEIERDLQSKILEKTPRTLVSAREF